MTPTWKNETPERVREIIEAGDKKLEAQMQLATSADQRANVLAGVYSATAAGIAAALASVWQSASVGVVTAAGFTDAALMISAFLCVISTLPVDFWTPGLAPGEWYDDLISKKDLSESLGENAENINDKISENDATLARNARLFKWGALLGLFAPVIGAAGAAISLLPHGM